MSLNSLLTQTCSIYTRTTSVGAIGDANQVYALAYSSVRCRAVHQQNRWGRENGLIAATAIHLLYIDQPYTLDTSMRVVLDDGTTYQVTHADMKHDSRGHHHAEYLIEAVESPQSGA